MDISLTPKLEEMIREKVASGFYDDASDVVREALRLLAARDESLAQARLSLLEAIEVGEADLTAGRFSVIEPEDDIRAFFDRL
ncbi:type II toxin-antitoxin system ParD family antitoxin [Segnochrobactrum spirostomi]|uniref:Type II toxin-antitoxin system ParD family antitoxin n=1 Tax=Segnochrobactrum spirostomi TaxID=2608987 RepID=A0A6A7Y4E0_9HYPH|nr:type II toxin-antitoxin system ParD family antitoxin [Segnochrobactrum spirostomi]MQT12612.1 type II toxin-antitoxin system ParD family antitoxin [Segnochrobactrum spirostomi]